MATFAERLTAARNARGVTKADLAVLVGRNARSVVTAWESGKSIPDAPILIRLAELLGVTVDWLLGVDTDGRSPEVLDLHEVLLSQRPITLQGRPVTPADRARIWAMVWSVHATMNDLMNFVIFSEDGLAGSSLPSSVGAAHAAGAPEPQDDNVPPAGDPT